MDKISIFDVFDGLVNEKGNFKKNMETLFINFENQNPVSNFNTSKNNSSKISKNSKKHCKHGMSKYYCRICGGNQLCIHNKSKNYCRDCGGSQFCKHGLRKSHCRDCGGSQLCVHDKRKYYCLICKGSQICAHGKFKRNCSDCGGKNICQHNKIKHNCNMCSSIYCKEEGCSKRSSKKWNGYCRACFTV